MITLNYLVRKKSDISTEEFREYWLDAHAGQSRQLSPGLGFKKYTKSETLHDDETNKMLQVMYGTSNDSYDFVDQMVIYNLEEFRTGLNDGEIQSGLKQLHADADRVVDYNRSDYWLSVDVPQLYPREEITATCDSTFLKVFYVPRRIEKLKLGEAQLHWNTCHGGMARQFARILPFDKYIQGHRQPSVLTDKLKSTLGGNFENNELIIGQAEAWLDRRILPALQGAEVERMMRLLVQDIDLFVNAKDSHIFATKEHIIHSQPIISGPIPCLFNAD